MREIITLKGLASSRSWTLPVNEQDLDKSLLDFLRDGGFPIASSCSGQGKCEKCSFNGNKLSCEVRVKDFLGKEIRIDYL